MFIFMSTIVRKKQKKAGEEVIHSLKTIFFGEKDWYFVNKV